MPKEGRNDEIGIYYVQVYGYRNFPVFLSEKDKKAYISRICRYRKKTGIRIHAYLIEENTAHLILETGADGQMADFMKRLGISYSRYFRNCYAVERGRIFRDRYRSEKIEDRKKLIQLVRALHQNKDRHIRPYSSYYEYHRLDPQIDTRTILDEIRYSSTGTNRQTGEGMMLGEKIERGAFSDSEVRRMLDQAYEKIKKEEPMIEDEVCLMRAVRSILSDRRISVRQLGRVSGISKSKVDRLRQIFG